MEDVQELFGIRVMFFDQFCQCSGLRKGIGVHGWDYNIIGLDSLRDGDDFGIGRVSRHGKR